jgi:hypothetical protein
MNASSSENSKSMASRTMGVRFHSVLEYAATENIFAEMKDMTTDQWLKIDSDKYSSIEEQLTQLHEKSFDVYHEYDNSKGRTLPEMNLEWGSFTKHLNIMKTVIDRYYDDATFKSLLPPGTTKEFLYLLVDFHDLGRICNMNALSELVMSDNVSHHLLKTIAPNFPQEHFA